MITDQKQTSVPNAQGIKQRTQLVKPHNQVSNPGNVANKIPHQTSSSKGQQITSANNQRATLAQQLLANAQQAAQQKTQSQMAQETQQLSSNYNDDARNAIRQMNDSELNSLLDDISTGKLKGNISSVDGIFQTNPAIK